MDLRFDVDLSSFATVTDMEIGENKVFILTDKHELLAYNQNGDPVFDTVFASPRLYPNGAVEAYLNNSFRSIFYVDGKLYFLGTNPSDIFSFEIEKREFSKKRVNLSEMGLHRVIGSNQDDLIVGFRSPQKGISQVFKITFPAFKAELLDEFSNAKSPNHLTSYSVQDDLFIYRSREFGLLKYEKKSFIQESGDFFLDSILYKGELKRITDLSQYSSLEAWERNQHQSDELLSAVQISDSDSYFLVKLLNRTDPEGPDFSICLIKKSGDNIIQKKLEDFQFAKLDPETYAFLGFTGNDEVVVISDLDSFFQ
jgi:hypothetical protein